MFFLMKALRRWSVRAVERRRRPSAIKNRTEGRPSVADETRTDDRTEGATSEEFSFVPPSILGGYRLLKIVGEGGFGQVWKAESPESGQVVALKIALVERLEPPMTRELFLREADVLRRLDHPGIPACHASGTDEGCAFIATDFIRACNLHDQIALMEPVEPKACAEFVADVCDIVAHMHVRGLIHRDLKPANILTDEEGSPHLIDFCGATALEDVGKREFPCQGTLAYMSPEQLFRDETIDYRTDVYSLGAILYHLLTGRLPRVGKNRDEILASFENDELTPPRRLERDVGPELDELCVRSLSRRLTERPASAGDFAKELRRCARSTPPKRGWLSSILGVARR
jgi:serine/threonine protein kinase